MVLYLLSSSRRPASSSSRSTRAIPTSCTGRRETRSSRSRTARAIIQWLVYATTLFLAALVPLVLGPDDPSTDAPTASLTMTFVVMGLGTVFNALTNRRDPTSGLDAPILKALAIALVPIALLVLATELPGLQKGLLTTSLTGHAVGSLPRARPAPAARRSRRASWLRRRRSLERPIGARPAACPRAPAARSPRARTRERPSRRPSRHRSSEVREMAKTKTKKQKAKGSSNGHAETCSVGRGRAGRAASAAPRIRRAAKMKRKEYEAEMRRLHGELVALQEWVKATGAKVCIVFEGRDTAGKGGTIRRITERVSPRVFRVVALPAPTEREKSQMYIQRYIRHFPAAGEVVIFDRSWYNRAGVEPVMGFCTPEQTERFLEQVPAVEQAMVESGIILLKYWLEVGPEEQTRRLESRIDDPRKVWKLSDMDLKSYSRWDDYSRARDAMFRGHRHGVGAMVRRGHERQEARPAQHHHATCSTRSRTSRSSTRDVELPPRQTADARHGGGPAPAAHPNAVLTVAPRIGELRSGRVRRDGSP